MKESTPVLPLPCSNLRLCSSISILWTFGHVTMTLLINKVWGGKIEYLSFQLVRSTLKCWRLRVPLPNVDWRSGLFL
jgi:hypothetical protein